MIHCAQCGYNLTGACSSTQPTGNCPECGTPFDFYLLTGQRQISQPRVTGPLLWLLAPPAAIAAAALAALWASNKVRGGTGTMLAWVGGSAAAVAALIGVALAIFVARRIARRLVMRPVGSRPSLGSTALTVLFSSIFVCCQGAVAFTVFFFGCLAIVAMNGF